MLIPESVVFLVLSPFGGALVAKVGPRWLMVTGTLAVAGGLCWLSAVHPGQSYAVTGATYDIDGGQQLLPGS